MKYTETPWKIEIWDYSKATPPRKDLVIENGKKRIAVLDWDQGLDNPYTIPEEEARNNAKLMTRAPEMYQCLKAIADMAEDENTDFAQLFTLCRVMARLEVEKVEGEI